ncbi:MAG: type II secretion system protein GspN, partial [Planctomycetes bacterium]|nr:type II secretion system protein GspN [Planctomycetota bacterium]
SELNLAAIPMVSALSGREITGRLSGVVTFQKPAGRPLSADARLMVSNGRLPLRNPVMGRQSVAFDKTQASVNLRSGKVSISALSLTGRELDMNAAGTMQLNAVVTKSEIAISGTFRLKDRSPSSPSAAPPPDPTTIPFAVSGTLADPMIRLNAASALDSRRQGRLESRDRHRSPAPPPEE